METDVSSLHSKEKSHEQVIVVEVTGRPAGWIALNIDDFF
jgi:6-phosphofructokinase